MDRLMRHLSACSVLSGLFLLPSREGRAESNAKKIASKKIIKTTGSTVSNAKDYDPYSCAMQAINQVSVLRICSALCM